MIRGIARFFRPRWHRLVLLACIFAFAFVVALSFAINDNQNQPSRENYKPIDVNTIEEGALNLNTGIYVNRIYNVDRVSGTFSANGWLWISWDKQKDIDLYKDDINIEMIKFMNEMPNTSRKEKLSAKPLEEYGNRMRQAMQFSSTFLINNQDYSEFPFEKIELPIEVGTDRYLSKFIVYSPDIKDSFVSDRVSLSGFKFRSLEARNFEHSYASRFGHSIDPKWIHKNTELTYSHLEWVVQFSRLTSSSIARLFIPVFAAMIVLMFSLLVSLKYAVPKITIPTSVLLVLAVLQERSHRLLPPDLTYLTYMDKIYMFCYILTLISLVSSLHCINRLQTASANNHHQLMISLADGQRTLVGVMSICITIVPLILWIL